MTKTVEGEYVPAKIEYQSNHKYKVGQKVYFIYGDKVKAMNIYQMIITEDETGKAIQYVFELPRQQGSREPLKLEEADVYETRRDLVNSILDGVGMDEL